jgi:C-terminal processing protease CtpA/Prc
MDLINGRTIRMKRNLKRVVWLAAPAVIAALAVPAFAGGDHKTCTYGTQECLDYMAKKLHDKGWIGVELNMDSGALEVTKVIADSPAETAGLKAGDILLAVNGVAYADENSEKMEAIRETMTKGKTFTFTVRKADKTEKDVDIILGSVPDNVLAQWVGEHMLQHAQVENAEE